jgi:hypothetical protein
LSGGAYARVVNQVGHDPIGAADLLLDDVDGLGYAGAGKIARESQKHVRGRLDGREWIADLVGNAAGQAAEHREPLLAHQIGLRRFQGGGALPHALLEQGVGSAQLFLGVLEARDVVDDANQVSDVPVRVHHGDLGGGKHVPATVAVGDGLLVNDDLGAAGKHLFVLLAKEGRLFRGEEIRIRFSEHLLAREARHLEERIVQEDELELAILHEDRVSYVVCHELKERAIERVPHQCRSVIPHEGRIHWWGPRSRVFSDLSSAPREWHPASRQ